MINDSFIVYNLKTKMNYLIQWICFIVEITLMNMLCKLSGTITLFISLCTFRTIVAWNNFMYILLHPTCSFRYILLILSNSLSCFCWAWAWVVILFGINFSPLMLLLGLLSLAPTFSLSPNFIHLTHFGRLEVDWIEIYLSILWLFLIIWRTDTISWYL